LFFHRKESSSTFRDLLAAQFSLSATTQLTKPPPHKAAQHEAASQAEGVKSLEKMGKGKVGGQQLEGEGSKRSPAERYLLRG